MSPAGPPDEIVDGLYGGDPKAFVATRDAAVKELRAAGRREEATAVKALARPTVAAAGVNAAVRGGAADALWAAGDVLAATQAALLAGDADADALRAAKAEHEDALAAAVDVAGEGARETLRAASVDAEVRAAVAGGRLVREVEPGAGGGFGGFEAAPDSKGSDPPESRRDSKGSDPPESKRDSKGSDPPESTKAAAAEEARAKEAAAAKKARDKEAAARRKALTKKLGPARARASKSAAALAEARERHERAEASATADAEAVTALEAELKSTDPA